MVGISNPTSPKSHHPKMPEMGSDLGLSSVDLKRKPRSFWFRKWHTFDVLSLTLTSSLHLMCLLGPFHFSWPAFWVSISLLVITGMLGITLSYHRHLTHKSFILPKWLEYIFTYCGVHALQGDPIFWVSTHRYHHQFADTSRDPHSPSVEPFGCYLGEYSSIRISKGWSEANFQRIVKPFGCYLKTEIKDFQESGLERARVLVETTRLDRIFEVFEAAVGGKVAEAVICEECFFNGRETEWKVEEPTDEGEEDLLICSSIEGMTSKGRLQCVVEQGGDRDRMLVQGGVRDWESDGVVSRWDSDGAMSVSPGHESQGTLESTQVVPESPLGKEETCLPSLSRTVGKEKEIGKQVSNREVSECSWDATLKSFLQQKGKGSARKEAEEQMGLGLCLPGPGEEGQGREHSLVECDESVLCIQAEGSADDNISYDEDSFRRLVRVEGAPKRKVSQKSSLVRDFDVKAQKTYKVVKRKDSKEKIVFKFQRRKKRAELDRLKKSYLEELEKSNKSNQLSEADRQLEVERVGLEEEARKLSQRKEAEEMGKYAKANQMMVEGTVPAQKLCEKELDAEELERRIKQRKEAEETYHFAWRLGIKGSLPEEDMIQIFVNQLEEKYVERMNGK